MKLHILKGCPYCTRVLFTIEACKIEVEIITHWDILSLKQPQILALNPKGKVPILITDEGVIYESEPILRYIAKQSPETGLYGSSDYEAALVDQWLKNTAEIDGGVFGQFLRLTGRFAPDEVAYKSSHENFSNAIKFIDDHLALRTYLTGHQVTIADIAFLSILLPAFTCVYTKKDRQTLFKNLSRYYDHLTSLPFFTRVMGNVRILEKPYKQMNAVDWTPVEGTPEFAKKEEEKKVQKPQKEVKKQQGPADAKDQAPKKQEKKTEKKQTDAKPKPAPVLAAPVEEKPKKREFIQSDFNLETFKTKIINAKGDEKIAVIQELTSNLDTNGKFFLKFTNPEAFSLWYGEYQKTPNEGKEKLKTNNLLNGYVKSCDGFKRAVYATYGYYGQEPDLQIRGVFLWHDPDFLPEMKEQSSCEFITWRKLDSKNQDDAKLVLEYWSNLEEGNTLSNGLTAGNVKIIH